MGLSFYLANSPEEITPDTPYAVFEIDFAKYLYEHPEKFPPRVASLLDLNPYGDEVFGPEGAVRLSEICKIIMETPLESVMLDEDINLQDFHPFAKKLRQLCKKAVETEGNIIVLGD